MIFKILTEVASKYIIPESKKYTSSSPWGKVMDYALDIIPLTGYPKQIFNIARKVFDYYQAITVLEEARKPLEKNIENLNAAMYEYRQQIHAASAAGLLDDYIQPLQKQLAIAEEKQRKMVEILYLMINSIKKTQSKMIFLEQTSKKINF